LDNSHRENTHFSGGVLRNCYGGFTGLGKWVGEGWWEWAFRD